MKAEKLSRFGLGASALGIIAFVLVAGLIDARAGTWFDEACTMTTARGPLGQTLSRALEMEAQPPLYFLGLNLWLRLYDTIGFARVFSTSSPSRDVSSPGGR